MASGGSHWTDVWANKVERIKQSHGEAKTEVRSGFRPQDKKKSHAVGATTPSTSKVPSSSGQPSGSGTRKASKGKAIDTLEEIQAIYFHPEANRYKSTVTNNRGEKQIHFEKIPSLDDLQKSSLELTGLACVSSPNNPLILDSTFTAQQTAERLADWFPDLYQIVNPGQGPVPTDWYYALIKTYKRLNSTPGQTGATASQLLNQATTQARDKNTREIFLAVPIEFTGSMRLKLNLPLVGKKRSNSDLDEGSSKATKITHSTAANRALHSLSGPRTRKASGQQTASTASPATEASTSSKVTSADVAMESVTPTPSLAPVPEDPIPPTPTTLPAALSSTETLQEEITKLEAATSSFVLDDDSDIEVVDHVPSPLTRSKQAQRSAAIVFDPVMMAYAKDDFRNPFSKDYELP
ncbi:hypothetical protein FS749_000971 [Ceratobasidium sp. UAMH 11750]|nr:hypothetical protein FS749_000971 [Ceratobasidium sp. UAMH 11750]